MRIRVLPFVPTRRFECFDCGATFVSKRKLKECPECESFHNFHEMA